MTPFSARLAAAVHRAGTPLCVGIDPWPDRLPLSGGRGGQGAPLRNASPRDLQALALRARDFANWVLDACVGVVPAVKPQFAFFEAMGPEGMEVLADTCARARAEGLIVVADAKRGDIGSTASAYAAATLGPDAPFPGDALTVNPFLGPDTIEPFLEAADAGGGGVFVLLRTSNPGSARWQAPVADDLTGWLAEVGAARVDASGLSNVGVVVGATKGEALAEARRKLPHAWILVPGYGAQGATAADTRAAARDDGLGALIVSARAATFPADGFSANPGADIRALVRAAREDLARGWGA